jgi:hypothetical protein
MMEVTWFEGGVDIGLANLENYRQIMESALQEQKRRFEEWIDKKAETLSDDEKEDFYEAYSDEHWELSDVFPSTLRSSLFVAAYSVLERKLVDYCTELWSKNKYSEKPNIPHRGIIFEARKYLTKYAGISIPDTSPNWSNIVCYNKIRNSIVHSGGKIDPQKLKELQPFLASNPSIHLDQFNKITLGEDACKDFINVVRGLFFDDLFKKTKV